MKYASKKSVRRNAENNKRRKVSPEYMRQRKRFLTNDVMFEGISIRNYLRDNIPWLYKVVFVDNRLMMTDDQDVEAILDWLTGAYLIFKDEKIKKAYKQIMRDCIKSTDSNGICDR